MDRITDEKLKRYFSVTEKALKMAEGRFDPERRKEAEDFFDMASRYFSDAGHFRSKGDKVTAFAALNYAHGWLDAGARIGLFKVKDSKLFTVDE
ncbi:TPA: DUF357 domain-containing protein [Candidatus Woesearchaeota archaeon]|nr:hypothetical protein QT06_C0001G1298 [archaeon GW2011_AR15]MBS3104244.1 DUF357 domain-containing protein [Candidatus Woesearchaeota archaeon]HIH41925.1 DUF357 domain-containing protein [Candidatus Woesearchaeota archaeon]